MTLLTRAQSWLGRMLPHFDPLAWGGRDAAFVRRKAFAELAVYAHVLGPDTPAAIDSLVVDRANDPEFHALLRRHPRQLLLYSAPLMHTVHTRRASPATLALVDQATTRPQVHALERSPHRQMDLWHFLTVVRRCPDWLDAHAILRASALAHQPTPFDCTLSEAYALTHDVLFLHNFGAPDPAFDHGPRYLLDPLSTALTIARFMAEGNADIVLELVMCLGLTGQLHGADLALILNWVEGRATDAGFIPGPAHAPDPALVAAGLHPDWLVNYHTTLVGAATLVLAGRGGWADRRAGPPLLDAPLPEVLAWGGVVACLNRYEIPKAVALLDRIEPGSGLGAQAGAAVADYLASIRDPATGIIGYWSDEFRAAATPARREDLARSLHQIAALAADILPETPHP
jgi:hypothetical protein